VLTTFVRVAEPPFEHIIVEWDAEGANSCDGATFRLLTEIHWKRALGLPKCRAYFRRLQNRHFLG